MSNCVVIFDTVSESGNTQCSNSCIDPTKPQGQCLMLADPQSVTIGGVTSSLPRVASGDGFGRFISADATVQETISHSRSGKNSTARLRHLFRTDLSKVAADPLFPAQNAPYSMSITLVVNAPVVGFTLAEQVAAAVGPLAQLSASTNALLTKIIGGEA